MAHYKPEGYNAISPYLVVDGAQKMVDLLKSIFNGETLRRFDREDGSITHVEIKIDDSVLMIGDATPEYPANRHLLHVYVPDVDHTFKKAMEAGCITIEEPRTREDDPDKRGTFEDFAGNHWAVSSQT